MLNKKDALRGNLIVLGMIAIACFVLKCYTVNESIMLAFIWEFLFSVIYAIERGLTKCLPKN